MFTANTVIVVWIEVESWNCSDPAFWHLPSEGKRKTEADKLLLFFNSSEFFHGLWPTMQFGTQYENIIGLTKAILNNLR